MSDSSRSLYVTSLSLVGFIIPLNLGQYTALISIFFTTFSRLLTRMQNTIDEQPLGHPVASELSRVLARLQWRSPFSALKGRWVNSLHHLWLSGRRERKPNAWLKDPWSSVMKPTLHQDPRKVDSSPRSASNKAGDLDKNCPTFV